jgi:N-acetyl-1-D-myo-inositol-2-amino-2-deoxy-alpha-D-glucopyranoside deacetylase
MSQRRRAAVLAVYAHPDDELFHGGLTLAHLSERGAQVTVACATKGEAGKVNPSVGPVADVGAHRAEELRLSCKRLGLGEPVFLGFHDSARKERQRHDDPRALANVDMLQVEAAVRRVIADVKPHVLVTFDPHGGYYHPDHLAVHRATTAAFFSSGVIGPEAPERLFFSVFSVEAYRAYAEATRGSGVADGLDPHVFAVAPEMIAVSFDTRPHMERKLAAFAAHQSAFGLTLETVMNPPPEQARILRGFRPLTEEEVFVLGGARGPIRHWPLADFFDGLDASWPDGTAAERR